MIPEETIRLNTSFARCENCRNSFRAVKESTSRGRRDGFETSPSDLCYSKAFEVPIGRQPVKDAMRSASVWAVDGTAGCFLNGTDIPMNWTQLSPPGLHKQMSITKVNSHTPTFLGSIGQTETLQTTLCPLQRSGRKHLQEFFILQRAPRICPAPGTEDGPACRKTHSDGY